MAWDPAEYLLFALVHGDEFVQKLDNESIYQVLCF